MVIKHLPWEWPDDTAFLLLMAKYREFRLQSLKLAPDAYASTYEQEIEFESEVWRQRLTNPKAQHIVILRDTCRAKPSTELEAKGQSKVKENLILSCEWVGLVVVVERATESSQLGGKSPSEFNHAMAAYDREVRAQQQNWTYQLNGLFVCHSVRRLGLGQALVKSGIQCARMMAKQRSLTHASITILLDTWNEAARNLYGKHGFVKVGEEEYTVGHSKRRAWTMLCNLPCEE